MATPFSTTYSVKFTGKSGENSINKTISGFDEDWISADSNVNSLNNSIFGIIDSGTAVSFTINKSEKYAAYQS